MALIYFDKRLIVAKFVIAGADGAGSDTTLRALHGKLTARRKGEILAFGTDPEERSYVFEYDATRSNCPGFDLRVRVYALPGRVASPQHRDLVLRDVDGVMLVLDARPERMGANKAAVDDVAARVAGYGRPLGRTPLVVQVNQRDRLAARGPEAVTAGLGLPGGTVVPANARAGAGVLEAHDALFLDVTTRLRENLAGDLDAATLVATTGVPATDEDLVEQHTGALSGTAAVGLLDHAAVDLAAGLTRRFQALRSEERVEVPFQPREFAGMRPVHVLETRVEPDGVVVDLVMERLSGGEPRRLPLVLANRPPDARPVQRHATSPAEHAEKAVTKDLPDKVDLAPPEPEDFPPVWYGIAGHAAGILVGLLIAYLFFA